MNLVWVGLRVIWGDHMDGHRQVEAVHQRDVKVILQVKHHHHPPHVQSLVFAWLLAFKVNSASVTGGTPPLGTWSKIKIKLQGIATRQQLQGNRKTHIVSATLDPRSTVSSLAVKVLMRRPCAPCPRPKPDKNQDLGSKIRIKDQDSRIPCSGLKPDKVWWRHQKTESHLASWFQCS